MNSMDKYSETEWLKYQQSNTAQSINELIVQTEDVSCDGECKECDCDALENEFISHAQDRKETPVFSGVINYFPDAIKAVSRCSFVGNQQHNPDKPLHWDRAKSGDELDALMRHLIDSGTIDTDGIRHSTKVAWRALANLQKEIENESK